MKKRPGFYVLVAICVLMAVGLVKYGYSRPGTVTFELFKGESWVNGQVHVFAKDGKKMEGIESIQIDEVTYRLPPGTYKVQLANTELCFGFTGPRECRPCEVPPLWGTDEFTVMPGGKTTMNIDAKAYDEMEDTCLEKIRETEEYGTVDVELVVDSSGCAPGETISNIADEDFCGYTTSGGNPSCHRPANTPEDCKGFCSGGSDGAFIKDEQTNSHTCVCFNDK